MKELFTDIFDVAIRLASSVKWYDFVDVALVAVTLYYVIKLLRQTRAFQLVKGIVLVGFVYFVVSSFNMAASSYLLNRIFSDIVIVIILLFQPEIRHTIESFGRGNLKKLNIFSGKNDGENNEKVKSVVTNIAKACSNMSDKKVGALMVIEGKTLLGEIINSGCTFNSSVTSILIETIFFPKSPLHDGAVVIRDDKICAAGCILPLTQSELSSELGTRHRAALGISENSDALVIVVSEETGAVSIAMKGTLERNVSSGELFEALTNFLTADSRDKTSRILRRKKQ